MDNAQLEIDGAASLKIVVTDSKPSCPRFIIRAIVVMNQNQNQNVHLFDPHTI